MIAKIFFLPKQLSMLHATTEHIAPAIDRARCGSSRQQEVQQARVIGEARKRVEVAAGVRRDAADDCCC